MGGDETSDGHKEKGNLLWWKRISKVFRILQRAMVWRPQCRYQMDFMWPVDVDILSATHRARSSVGKNCSKKMVLNHSEALPI